MPARPKAVVLLSGGLDSATVLAMASRDGYAVHALTVDYGQRHRVEIEHARRIASRQGVEEHRVIGLDMRPLGGSALTDASIEVPKGRADEEIARGIPVTYVPARNTIFLALALAWAESLEAQAVFIGVNSLDYSGYPDCRPEFLRAFESLAGLATRAGLEGRGPRILAPLIHLRKAEIVREAVALGVDLRSTFSCYAPGPSGEACGRCDACRLRARGFSEAGVEDPA